MVNGAQHGACPGASMTSDRKGSTQAEGSLRAVRSDSQTAFSGVARKKKKHYKTYSCP